VCMLPSLSILRRAAVAPRYPSAGPKPSEMTILFRLLCQ
jgi:hypothetical protein